LGIGLGKKGCLGQHQKKINQQAEISRTLFFIKSTIEINFFLF